MARLIEEHWGAALRQQRQEIEEIVKSGNPFTNHLPPGRIRARSLTQPCLDVNIGPELLDPKPYGTFSDHPDARAVILYVQRSAKLQSGARANSWDRIPEDEEEEWVFAALGPKWFDYAYRANTTRMLLRAKPVRYVTFVTSEGEPYLAPGDFAWQYTAEATTVRQKLRPRSPSAELREHLVYVGDVVPVEHISTGNKRVGYARPAE